MNDTSKTELDEQLDKILHEYEIGFVTHGRDVNEHFAAYKQALTTLIAQREQAAELRGRIDAAYFFRNTLSDKELRSIERTTLRTWQMYAEELEQATKPEKGKKE